MKFPETYRYLNLVKANTPYAKNMWYLSNRIFVDPPRPVPHGSMKVVRIFEEEPLYKRDYLVNYYPRHPEMGYLFKFLREYGLFRDEHLDFKEEMIRLQALRGKVPRPYGSGPKKTKTLLETKKK